MVVREQLSNGSPRLRLDFQWAENPVAPWWLEKEEEGFKVKSTEVPIVHLRASASGTASVHVIAAEMSEYAGSWE